MDARRLLGALVAELSGYNPTVGAVHGVQFVRFGDLAIGAAGGNGVSSAAAAGAAAEWAAVANESTAKGPPPSPPTGVAVSSTSAAEVSGEIGGQKPKAEPVAPPPPAPPPEPEVPLLANGSRVLVALADGLMHSALIRQAMQGYYELEIETTGETVWVPVTMVSPQ